MRAEFDSSDGLAGTFENIGNYFWCGVARGVRQRNGFDANVFEPLESFFDQFRAPWLVVGISESHGNVNHESAARSFGFFAQSFNEGAGFSARHVGIRSAKVRGDG